MSDKYSAADIQVLTGLEAIRKRPSMYVGPLDDSTLLSKLVIESCCMAFADAKRGLVKNEVRDMRS
jgi:DNA gyrase/topoisomerase IV subunit B